MSDSSTSSFSYETLIKHIGSFDEAQKAIVKDKSAMTSFADSIVKGETEIAKFVQSKSQIETYLDGYDFRGGFQFDDMNKKIGSLLTLRSKLATMADEAKKLSTYPDRYGSQRAVGLCRDLAIKCREKLRLEEAEKAIALAEANTQKLISIRSQFESDGDVLYQINEAIDSNMNVLGKFKAYLAEIRRYVDAFPHSGQDDLGEINKRIDAAKQINTLLEKTQKSVDSIKGYADRHNKKAVVTRLQSVVNEMASKMCYADIEKYKPILGDIMKQAQMVVKSFEDEKSELQGVYDYLCTRNANKWKEDTERMIDKVSDLLHSDTKTRAFDLSQIKSNLKDLVDRRSKDIKATVNEHPWLENGRHSGFHSNLVNSYITKSDYLSQIDNARKERLKKIWKWVGIGAGIASVITLLVLSSTARWIAVAIVVIALIIIFKNS